jgi:DNA-binding IclR family transcriptional regulator
MTKRQASAAEPRTTNYINEPQQRLLQLIDLLAGHEIQGLAPSEIAKAMRCSAPQVTRDMENLRHAGWAERTPKGDRWRLSPHPIQLAIRHAQALSDGKRALDDVAQRFSRS